MESSLNLIPRITDIADEHRQRHENRCSFCENVILWHVLYLLHYFTIYFFSCSAISRERSFLPETSDIHAKNRRVKLPVPCNALCGSRCYTRRARTKRKSSMIEKSIYEVPTKTIVAAVDNRQCNHTLGNDDAAEPRMACLICLIPCK